MVWWHSSIVEVKFNDRCNTSTVIEVHALWERIGLPVAGQAEYIVRRKKLAWRWVWVRSYSGPRRDDETRVPYGTCGLDQNHTRSTVLSVQDEILSYREKNITTKRYRIVRRILASGYIQRSHILVITEVQIRLSWWLKWVYDMTVEFNAPAWQMESGASTVLVL